MASGDMQSIGSRLKERFGSMTREERDKMFESITHFKFWARWVEKVAALPKEKRAVLIAKIVEKYESDAYRSARNFEPDELLYTLLFEYGMIYGEHLQADDNDISVCRVLIDGEWVVDLYQGQGSVYKVSRFDLEEETRKLDIEIEFAESHLSDLKEERAVFEKISKEQTKRK